MHEAQKNLGPVRISVNEGIELAAIQKTIAELVRLGGCTACGLAGFDHIMLHVVNPALDRELGNLREIPGVVNVSIGARF